MVHVLDRAVAHDADLLFRVAVREDGRAAVGRAAGLPARGAGLGGGGGAVSSAPSIPMPSAPKAARRDGRLYELLALIDVLREGRTRERQIAENELLKRIHRT